MFQRAARCSRMFLSLSALHLSAAAPDAAAGGPLLSLLSVWELQFVQHGVCVCVCTNSDIIISYRWKHMWLSIKVFARGRAKHRRHKSVLLCGRTGVFLLLFFYSVSLETCRCSHTMQTSVVCLVLPPVCVTESSRLTLPPPHFPSAIDESHRHVASKRTVAWQLAKSRTSPGSVRRTASCY